MFCRILAEGRCSLHTMHKCLRFLRRGICPNLNHFWTTNFRNRCFCLCQFCFCVSAKMHRNRERPFKTSGMARAHEDFNSLKFCRSLFSSALKLRNRGGNFMEMLSSGNLRKPRQETSETKMGIFWNSVVQQFSFFLDIQIFAKNWYYCACVAWF